MTNRLAVTLALALGTGLLLVSWWLIGDLSSSGFSPDELDYMVRTPDVIERNSATAGVVGAVTAAVGLVVVSLLFLGGRLERRSLILIGAGAGCGAFLGLAARTITAGGIGANIGAGLVILFGVPAAVVGLRAAYRAATGPASSA